MASLHDLLNEVTDRESFLAFARALAHDRAEEVATEAHAPSPPYGPGVNGWENGTIGTFLEAAIAWAEAMTDREGGVTSAPSWESFARFLYAGKVYE